MSTTEATPALANVVVKDLPAQEYLGQRFTSQLGTVGRDVQAAFARLYGLIGEAHSSPAGPPFLIASQPKDGAMEIDVGAPCAPVPAPPEGMHAGHLEAGRAAVLLYRGPYERLGEVYEQVFGWIARNGYSPAGPPREVYLNGPAEVQNSSDYLTEVIVPVR